MDELEAYDAVRRMIYHEVNQARRKLGIEADDLIGEANLAFCVAFREYDPELAALTTKVWWNVRGAITRIVRQFVRDKKTIMRDYDVSQIAFSARPAFDLPELLTRLSNDGKIVVESVFEPPKQVLKTLRKLGVSAETVRTSIWFYLKERGWSNARIRNAFQEVKGAV